MKKVSTTKKMLVLVAGALLVSTVAMAGDGTKENPYTVSELNAQKDALAASGNTVWVKADLKGLGENGTSQSNADKDGKKQMAALFGDATDTFVAYSWQILGQLELDELTNTKDLLIALTYGTTGHPYGNTANAQYASNEEPTEAHFSLGEIHGALSISVSGGYRGYHVNSSFVVPADIVAIKVSAGYSSKSGAYLNCENVFDGAQTDATYVTPKNGALVLLANDGAHPVVLSANLYEQKISNGNAMNPGVQAGFYKREGNFTNYYYRFVNANGKLGFERNSDNMNEVTLESKDEVFLSVSGKDNNFFGMWTWETTDKKWISWNGKKYNDYHADDTSVKSAASVMNAPADIYNLQGIRLNQLQRGVNIVGGKKIVK